MSGFGTSSSSRGARWTEPAHNDDHGVDPELREVQELIRSAKHESEVKVSREIQRLKRRMDNLGTKMQVVQERLNNLSSSGALVLKADFQTSVKRLDEVWSSEVTSLKHDLLQTIQAHNRNADLIKAQKDVIEQMQARLSPNSLTVDLENWQEYLLMVEKATEREQAKQIQIDALTKRLTAVQQQLTVVNLAGIQRTGLSPVTAALGSGAAKKAAPKKAAKAKATFPKTPGGQTGLSAEAPEFVPAGAV